MNPVDLLVDAYLSTPQQFKIIYTDFGLLFDSELCIYIPRTPETPQLHLIETVLLEKKKWTGERYDDIAMALGVTTDWVQGYVVGMGMPFVLIARTHHLGLKEHPFLK